MREMATKSTKNPPREYSPHERLIIAQQRERIADARERLRKMGANVDIESDNPMDDVSYEQRNCRMKALDVAVAAISTDRVRFGDVVGFADTIYRYIWEGQVPSAEL